MGRKLENLQAGGRGQCWEADPSATGPSAVPAGPGTYAKGNQDEVDSAAQGSWLLILAEASP